jgi:ribosomal protein S18 acetylase RimI-like enzyme
MGSVVRPSTVDDLPDLLPLLRGYSSFYGAHPDDDALLGMARAFCGTTGEGAGGSQLLARADSGELVGFATVLWSWDTTTGSPLAVMEDLFVTERTRGQGVGRTLLEACAALARERGYGALTWETAPDNTRAQRLYDATGAERSTWLAYRLSLA